MANFDSAPFLAIWEVTQACDLACFHCRACAIPRRDPNELLTAEGYALLREIRALGNPLVVFTGGDPLKREDIFDLLAYSVKLGLRTTITPSATPLLTRAAVERFAATGVARMAISVDGADAADHDRFRGVAGAFERSLSALGWARGAGLETQVNTTVTRRNYRRLGEIARLVAEADARLWSVFFLIATGRALREDDLSAGEYEEVFEFLYRLAGDAPFDLKTTEAQHYRRFAAQRRKAEGGAYRAAGTPGAVARGAGINDGKGLVFISHTGEVYPSGFLPLSAGNVRTESLGEIYRESALFRALRQPGEFRGKCGVCEYRNLCGGSRSRAYALDGDAFGSDPRCAYLPPAWVEASAEEVSR